jgi:hypothetical protein
LENFDLDAEDLEFSDVGEELLEETSSLLGSDLSGEAGGLEFESKGNEDSDSIDLPPMPDFK